MGRYDIATGKEAPPVDPNKAIIETFNAHEIATTTIQRFSPKNGDVFFISCEKMTKSDWETLRVVIHNALKALHVTCGVILSTHEFKVTKEDMSNVARIEWTGPTSPDSETKESINDAILKSHSPAQDAMNINDTLSGVR